MMELVADSPELVLPSIPTPFLHASYYPSTVRLIPPRLRHSASAAAATAAAVGAAVAGAGAIDKPARPARPTTTTTAATASAGDRETVARPQPVRPKTRRKARRSNSLPIARKGTDTMSGFEIDEGALASHYQLLEELGSGSFGVVYKAIEKATGEIVAIKHIDLESSEEDIQEIQGEISVLSTCSSPYVTQYRTSFLRGSKLWIVMEYLGGGSCQDLLKPGPFNESHVAIVCRELLLGLDYLHREGKIHRDIKAANVLLARSGRVKLADFGVAAQLSNIKSIRMTFVGTPFWMAPEVIQESGYDFKADIWSLGITAMEMINGAPPHAEVHPMKVLFLIPKEPAPRLHGDYYSREMKDFVASCLVKDPDQRPTAKELLRHPFIRRAGKVEGLQEVIMRRQEWEASRGKAPHIKYYQETMKAMPVPTADVAMVDEDPDAWTFDTVKAATLARPPATAPPQYPTTRRQPSLSRASTLVEEGGEDPEFPPELEQTLADLSLSSQTSSHTGTQPQWPSPQAKKKTPRVSTVRHVSNAANSPKRRTHSKSIASPQKRKPSLMSSSTGGSTGTTHHRPSHSVAADMSYGATPSDSRPFRRVSSTSVSPPLSRSSSNSMVAYPPGLEPPPPSSHLPSHPPHTAPDLYTPQRPSPRAPAQRNFTPTATFVTRDALLGHRAFTRCVDPALAEVHASTGDFARRDAVGRAAAALADLNAVDPEGLWGLLVGTYAHIATDAKLRDALASQAGFPLAATPATRSAAGAAQTPLPPGVLGPASGNAGPGKENEGELGRRGSVAVAGKVPSPGAQRLVLADNNPHLKSHRRRQSSFLPASHDPLGVMGLGAGLGAKGLGGLPGEIVPGMEHTKQLADVLYGGWVNGLKGRWPQVQ